MLKFLNERTESKVSHLSSPQAGHTRQLKVLDTERVIRTAKLVRKLPLPIVTTIADVLVKTLKFDTPSLAVVGLPDDMSALRVRTVGIGPIPLVRSTGKIPGLMSQVLDALLQKQRILNPRAVTHRQIGLQPKIHSY